MSEPPPRAPLPGTVANQDAAPPEVPSAKPPLTEPSLAQERPIPMLDVHAPHVQWERDADLEVYRAINEAQRYNLSDYRWRRNNSHAPVVALLPQDSNVQ